MAIEPMRPRRARDRRADLEIAVACGATLVRVGTAIFGARTAV